MKMGVRASYTTEAMKKNSCRWASVPCIQREKNYNLDGRQKNIGQYGDRWRIAKIVHNDYA